MVPSKDIQRQFLFLVIPNQKVGNVSLGSGSQIFEETRRFKI